MKYLLILLSICGATQILLYGSIFKAPRDLVSRSKLAKELISCVSCSSFWISVIFSTIAYNIDKDLFYIFIPFAGSAAATLFDYIITVLDKIWIKSRQ